MYCFCDFDMAH